MNQLKALPKFERQYKKFYPREKTLIREEIKKIELNPLLGELKKGALSNVRVHKFKIRHQFYLLAYEYNSKEKTIYLYAIATHENFYDILRKYLKT